MYGSPNIPISDPDAEGEVSNLEPGTWGGTDADHVQCSIAISLKRIADALHGDDLNTGMKHALAEMANRAHNGWGPSS